MKSKLFKLFIIFVLVLSSIPFNFFGGDFSKVQAATDIPYFDGTDDTQVSVYDLISEFDGYRRVDPNNKAEAVFLGKYRYATIYEGKIAESHIVSGNTNTGFAIPDTSKSTTKAYKNDQWIHLVPYNLGTARNIIKKEDLTSTEFINVYKGSQKAYEDKLKLYQPNTKYGDVSHGNYYYIGDVVKRAGGFAKNVNDTSIDHLNPTRLQILVTSYPHITNFSVPKTKYDVNEEIQFSFKGFEYNYNGDSYTASISVKRDGVETGEKPTVSGTSTKGVTSSLAPKQDAGHTGSLENTVSYSPNKPGTYTFELTLEDGVYRTAVSQELVVVVTDPYTPTLVVTPPTQTTKVGQSVKYEAHILRPNGELENVTESSDWKTVDTNIALSTGDGNVQGVTVGTTTVQAEYDDLKGTATVNVISNPATKGLTIEPPKRTIETRMTASYRAYYTDENGVKKEVTDIADWSGGGSISTNLGKGKYKGDVVGTSEVKVYYNNLSATAELEVIQGLQPPKAVITGPSEVEEGKKFCIRSNSYDPDGEIVKHDWDLDGMESSVTNWAGMGVNNWGECGMYFPSTGDKTVSLTVEDNDSLWNGTDHFIKVTAAPPRASFNVNGYLIENRAVWLEFGRFYRSGIAGSPIVEKKITVKALDTANQDQIINVESVNLNNIDHTKPLKLLFRKQGTYEITYFVKNQRGATATRKETINVIEDLKPVAKVDHATPIYLPNGTATIKLEDLSYSSDDILEYRKWEIAYDKNNNGIYENSEYTTVYEGTANAVYDYNISKYGKYSVRLTVFETFNEDTWPTVVNLTTNTAASHRKYDVVTSEFEVDNMAPVVSLSAKKQPEVEIVFNTGDVVDEDVYTETKLRNQITTNLLPGLLAENINPDIQIQNREYKKTTPIAYASKEFYYGNNNSQNHYKIYQINLDSGNVKDTGIQAPTKVFGTNLRKPMLVSDYEGDAYYLKVSQNMASIEDKYDVYKYDAKTEQSKIILTGEKIDQLARQHDFPIHSSGRVLGGLASMNISPNGNIYLFFKPAAQGTHSSRKVLFLELRSDGQILRQANGTIGDNYGEIIDYVSDDYVYLRKTGTNSITMHYLKDILTTGFHAYGENVAYSSAMSGYYDNRYFLGHLYYHPNKDTILTKHASNNVLFKHVWNANQRYSNTVGGIQGGKVGEWNSNGLINQLNRKGDVVSANIYSFSKDNTIYTIDGTGTDQKIVKRSETTPTTIVQTRSLGSEYDFYGLGRPVYTQKKTLVEQLGDVKWKSETSEKFFVTLSNAKVDNLPDEKNAAAKALDVNGAHYITINTNSTKTVTEQLMAAIAGKSLQVTTTYTDNNVKDAMQKMAKFIVGVVFPPDEAGIKIHVGYDSSSHTLVNINTQINVLKKGLAEASIEATVTSTALGTATMNGQSVKKFNVSTAQDYYVLVADSALNANNITKMSSDVLLADAYFVGYGKAASKSSLDSVISKNMYRGKYIDNTNLANSMQTLTDYLVKTIGKRANETVIYGLTSANEIMYETHYNDYENHLKFKELFKTTHDETVFENNLGKEYFTGSNFTTNPVKYSKVGLYMPTYQAQDDPIRNYSAADKLLFDNYRKWSNIADNAKIYMHRAPVADFSFTVNTTSGAVTVTNKAYDLDKQSINIGNGAGIAKQKFSYKSNADNVWKDGVPSTVGPTEVITIRNFVTDYQFQTSYVDKEVARFNMPPVADFDPVPEVIYQGEKVNFINKSYEPTGQKMTAKWYYKRSTQGDSSYTLFATGEYNNGAGNANWNPFTTALNVVGKYDIKLVVTDTDNMSDQMVKQVTVIEAPQLPPIANFKPEPATIYQGETTKLINLSTDPQALNLTATWQYRKKGTGTWTNLVTGNFTNGTGNANWSPTTATLNQIGTYEVRLTVTNTHNLSDSVIKEVEVLQPPNILEMGIRSLEVFTAPATQGLPVYLELDETILLLNQTQITEARNLPITIDVYRDGQLHESHSALVKTLLDGHMFVIQPKNVLVKDKAYTFNFVISSADEKVLVNPAAKQLSVTARTAAEKTIVPSLDYKYEGLLSAKRLIGTDQVNTYEMIRVKTKELLPTVTGFGHELDQEFTYELPKNQHYKTSAQVFAPTSELKFDGKLIDSHFNGATISNTGVATLQTVRKDYVNTLAADKETTKLTQAFPKVYVEKNTGYIFSQMQKDANDGRIQQQLLDGGHKLYVPIWLDPIGKYEISYATNAMGVNKVSFAVKQDLELEGYLFLHMNSTTKDKDKWLLEPVNKKNPFSQGTPAGWSNQDVEWLKK